MQRGPRTITRASRESGIPEEAILLFAVKGQIGQPVGGRYAFSYEDVQWLKENVVVIASKKPVPNYRDKWWLLDQLSHKTVNQIAKETGKAHATIRYWCHKYNIPRPDFSESRKRVLERKK